ncbi:MAG: Na(+)-translocating NADH-quinone reductase subunit C [Gammaproteobacteria bacterium]|nr:Na(+)-translocating NADH-quinone reductase subunit C [Gammaproteobacteria bacterium]NBT45117.1 Na(+)-translocating NADH-quinone reductase subunit C [Gammaproteobacteria bacterium]NBY22715.1 Na(+)-translocating NADH-quinone reductase subunit C [Gammaproteobacteria bacterium]NDE34585.1 Na(+)-translocating NADH-quinone reductase subunit C [Gammaproteobacteria bacterium]NDE55640.1 Na(+)-translocating NADH-quinone reductase subunit C [Gammaproteobacteria bacterium]
MEKSSVEPGFKEKLAGYTAGVQAYAAPYLALPNDSFKKTVAVALALCLVGAIVVSGSAVILRPLQEWNKSKDEKVNILEVADLYQPGVDVETVFKNIEVRLVDLATGDYAEGMDAKSYDQWKAAKDPLLSEAIPANKDIASIKRKPKVAKVYLVKEGDQLKTLILPVNGYGLWSTMFGFIALEADAETVVGMNLYDQAETPGLGGEVVNPKWKALWKGKKVYNFTGKEFHENNLSEKGQTIEIGEVALGLVKGFVDPGKAGSEYQVDALAGATLTSRGVSNLVQYWMGKEGYGIYLAKIRNRRG